MALQETNPLSDITGLVNLLTGTSSSSTTSSNISKTGMDYLMQQVLSGSNGIASISGGTRAAGGYNSTAQSLLTNDLITRAAGNLASQQAGTTTTNKTSAKVGGSSLLTVAASMGANKLLSPTIKGLSKKLGIDDIGDSIANAFGVGSLQASGVDAATSAAWSSNAAGLGGDTLSALTSLASSTPDALLASSAVANTADAISVGEAGWGADLGTDALTATSATSAASAASTVAGVGEAGWGLDLGTDLLADTAADATVDLAADAALDFAIPYAGPILLANQLLGNPLGDVFNGVGGAIEDAVGGIGDFFGDLFGW